MAYVLCLCIASLAAARQPGVGKIVPQPLVPDMIPTPVLGTVRPFRTPRVMKVQFTFRQM